MKYKLITMLLAFALLLTMAGCSAARTGQALDRAGERVENGLDAMEDTVENAVRRAAPNPAVADNTQNTSAAEHTAVPSETSSADTITKAQAENIALKHAGFTADQVSRLHTEYEVDNGIPQYDVEFHKDNIEYEFEIHAQTGEILSFDKDHEND